MWYKQVLAQFGGGVNFSEEEKVDSKNVSEIDKIREIYNVSTINIFLLWCAPVLVSTISIGVYQYLVEILKLF